MKYVIFDIDGTLTNTKKVEDKCFMQAFEQTFNIDIWNQKWESFSNVTDWGITEEIIENTKQRKPNRTEYAQMISNFTTRLKAEKERDITQFKEVEGAKAFFYELKEIKEIQLGIATGSWEKSALIKLDSIGIEVNDICFSNSDYHKSREAITQDVINQLRNKTKKSPHQVIYFGDGKWDFKTCQNLGIDFIGIDIERDEKLTKMGAKTVFQNYKNKNEILEKIL